MGKNKHHRLQNELRLFLKEAFKHAKEKGISRLELSKWLHTKNIAIKEAVFDQKTFIPHIKIDYLDGKKIREFTFELAELDGRTNQEIWNEVQEQAIQEQEKKVEA